MSKAGKLLASVQNISETKDFTYISNKKQQVESDSYYILIRIINPGFKRTLLRGPYSKSEINKKAQEAQSSNGNATVTQHLGKDLIGKYY